MASNNNLSHNAIWDDSALVDSWNDALEEYKKYHSIKARGENVHEVLLKAAENDSNETGGMEYEEAFDEPQVDGAHAGDNLHEETVDHISKPAEAQDKYTEPEQSAETRPPVLPGHLIGQVHDEGLKNLLMSWYYAGYYTGLYEGQQGNAVQKA